MLIQLDGILGQSILVVEHFYGRLVIRSYEICLINNSWRLHKLTSKPITPNIAILVHLYLYQELLCPPLYLLLMAQRCLLKIEIGRSHANLCVRIHIVLALGLGDLHYLLL